AGRKHADKSPLQSFDLSAGDFRISGESDVYNCIANAVQGQHRQVVRDDIGAEDRGAIEFAEQYVVSHRHDVAEHGEHESVFPEIKHQAKRSIVELQTRSVRMKQI